jgi:hypothetical protein
MGPLSMDCDLAMMRELAAPFVSEAQWIRLQVAKLKQTPL